MSVGGTNILLVPPEPNPEQRSIIDHPAGGLLVTGGPGSGKTWALRERFARLIEAGVDPERVALFTLTRRAGRDARDQVARRLGRSVSDLRIFSVHGYANSFVTERWFHELGYSVQPSVLSAPEQYAQVAEALADENDSDWPQLGHLRGVRTFGRQIADLMLRCQERLLDPDELDAAVKAAGRSDYLEVAAFYRRYVSAQESSDEVDFGGLLQQTARKLEAGVPEEERFEHVLVDDFQDATIAAGAIVKALAAAADGAVFAADPAGHVFTFQGGSLEPLRSLPVAFPSIGTVELAGSHRLGAGLTALAALTDPGAEAPEPEPHFEARLMAHPGEEIEAVADEILRLRVDEDVPWSEIAIVMRRYGSYLNGLRHALARHRIPFTVVAEETALPTEPAIRPLIDLLRFVYRPTLRADLLETVLASPLVGLDPHELRRLRRESRAARVTLLDLVQNGGPDRPEEPILATKVGYFRELVSDIPRIEKRLGPDGLLFELWTRRPDAAELVASDEPSARRALDAISAFADTIYRFAERRPEASIKDYLETLEAVDFAPDPWIPPEERRPDAVRVISAHRTQGLEFEAVLIPGCLEGEFPSLSRGDPLVSIERLIDPTSPSERLRARAAEERALFRMAVSRARRRTILFASSSAGDRNPRTPSRFAAKLGLQWLPTGDPGGTGGTGGAPASLRSMETALRRHLADPMEPAARRLAAAAALPATGARPERWWGRNEWTDPGVELHPDGDEYKTSYSRISPMENCGLQYLYAQELGLDNETSHAMWVGTLFHSIVDRVQRGEIPRSEIAILETFESEWDPARFESGVVEHQRHRDMEGMLLTWLDADWGTPLRSEVGFSFELPGATLRGKIDAVFPMADGKVRVVDYKTSRYSVSVAEAQESLQLATYYLAVKRTPELAELGEPASLELAYPAQPFKRGGFAIRSADPSKTADYEEENTERLTQLIAAVRQEDFMPDADADCRYCRFKTICPLYPEGNEAPVAIGRQAEGACR